MVEGIGRSMLKGESQRGAFLRACVVNRCLACMRTNKALFLIVLVVISITLVPLYGILFPPLVDLPEHLLVSKLLWETVFHVSRLDLEISWYLSYRLFSFLMLIFITFFK